MKSIKIFATVGAIALLGMAGLSSCNQKNGPQGPEVYDGKTVKTEFSIAIPDLSGSNGNVRRMPGTTVQTDASEFQGIKNITLIPFKTQGDAKPIIGGEDTRLATNIVLEDGFTKADYTTASNDGAKAKVYEDVAIPLTTASFLFYGESNATGTDDNIADGFETGVLTASITANKPEDFVFRLSQILPNAATELATVDTKGDKLLKYLTSVACADDDANKTDDTPGTPWYAITSDAGMQAIFTAFTSMHGLSSFEVARVLSDLYTSLKPLTSNVLAQNICDAINNSTYVESLTSPSTGKYVITLKEDINDFPQYYNLPQGSIDIKWVSTTTEHKFTYGDYSQMASPEKFVYPSSLWYYANSIIRTSNSSKKALYTDNATTSDTWQEILNAHTDGAAVNTRTRAVAIEDVVQYGVARLDVTVKLGGTSLVDNSDQVESQGTAVSCSSGFAVTGILIGNQKNVGYNFAPKASETAVYTIYDKVMSSSIIAKAADPTATNHTLVLETATGVDVMVAVEMENPSTGVDFYGVDNQLIPKGGKFYVIGKLKAADASVTSNVVFKQDYTTLVNFTLTDLRKAYNTIPDLRTPQLELGFSVDLEWKEGNVYDISFGNY